MPARFISHYRLVRRLGEGGMGEVYQALDTRLERPVALKVMSAELAQDPNQRKRFRTEAKAASGLNHPHICVIHEVGETKDGRPFLAMEYIEGQPLDVVLQERRLKIREVLQLGIDVAEALAEAHGRGLVHRDIKPGNLMLDVHGRVKVLDFGLAKWFAPDELSGAATSVARTQTGVLVGTPQYMSPEQALGRPVDPRTDLFSLGVVLYELVTGQRPFLGNTVGEIINNIVNQPVAPLGLENPAFSPALDEIIFKCLEKEPERRYGSATELATELRKLKEESERMLSAPAPERTVVLGTMASPADRQRTALWRAAANVGNGSKAARVLALATATVVLLVMAGWILWRTSGTKVSSPFGTAPTATAQPKSVAVLPFVNLSADKGDEYLSDGMTEELLNALTKIKGLRVPGRSSSFAFKGKTEEGIFRKVGHQLQVQAVLEGSVRKADNQLRITAQLINVADGFHLWSETYDRDMTNIFAIQSEIALRVAEALKVQLLGQAPEPTGNIEAYQLYLQGRFLWNRRTGESIQQAIEHFNQAIAKDPGYALAYAGLADCYQVLPAYHPTAPREVETKGRAAALKALELNPRLAGPFAALAAFKESYDWDWKGAEADYRRAIELDPNYPTARQWFAESLTAQSRYEEGLREARQALELDPLSPVINAVLGKVLIAAGNPAEATEVLRKEVAANPGFPLAHQLLAWACVAQGNPAGALSECETATRLQADWVLGELGYCYARTSRPEDARRVLQELLELQRKGKDVSLEIATVQQGMGNEEQALACLERAAAEHSFHLQFVMQYPFLKELLPHPRTRAILKKMNLVK